MYLVTARHVVESIRSKGLSEVWLRLNHTDGTSKWFSSSLEQWFVHEADGSIDAAILRAGIPDGFDHLVFPWSLCITPERMKENEVGLGEEVFIVGLFRHHHGNNKNIPIVRIGNLASVGEEKVVTRDFGEMDAMLIEARSIGGLSGSPVLLNLGSVRTIGGQLKFAEEGMEYLRGLIHGHFDTSQSAVDAAEDDTGGGVSVERVNTGIAIVVPFHSISAIVDAYEQRKIS